ncbi:hypothetical protein [Actinomadura gamaensis]|uniref:Uncharacterized protein n=1 Tax=Actinomadura gamaensis TaxID=1763541 RepID=A0ABV9U433_9ACTN
MGGRHVAEAVRASAERASGGDGIHWLAELPAEVFVEAEAGPGEVLFSVPLIPLRPPSVPVEFDAWLAMRHWYRALRDVADQEVVLVTGLLSWRPPDGPPVRGHLLSTPVQIVMDDRTERVDVVLAGPTSPRDRELLAGVPGYQPARADWVWDAVQAGQGFALQASTSDVLRKWCAVAFTAEGERDRPRGGEPAVAYRDDWTPGGAPGEIPAVRLAPALAVRRRPRRTGLAGHYDLLISQLADPPPDGLVRFLAADLRVLHLPEPKPDAAAELVAGMTAQGRRVLVVRSEPEPGGIPPRADLPEVPPLTGGEAAELLRLLTERRLAPPADPAALPDPNRIRALINVERAVPPEASGEVARRLRQFDPAVLTRLTGRVAQVDGILNELGLGGHPSRWPSGDPAARAFADILARRRPAVWERVTEMTVQAERAHRAARSLRGHRVVLPPDASPRDLADAAHELRAHLLTGGTLKRGPIRSSAQRRAETLLTTVTVDGHPPTTPALLEIVLTHLTAEITCQELHYVWEAAGVPFRTDLPLADRAARFAEAHARLARVRILTPVLSEVAELGIPLTHPLQWHGLTIGLAAAHLAAEADRATAALTALRDAVDPALTDLRAALDARDPDAYTRALHAVADSHRIRARRDTLLARLRSVHPDLAARMTADPSAFEPLARTWTTAWATARRTTPGAVPLWDVPAAIPPTPDSLDAIILDNVQNAGPEALFLLWYTPRVILLGPPGPGLPPVDTPRPPLPQDLHDSLAPTTPLYESLLSRALSQPPTPTPRPEPSAPAEPAARAETPTRPERPTPGEDLADAGTSARGEHRRHGEDLARGRTPAPGEDLARRGTHTRGEPPTPDEDRVQGRPPARGDRAAHGEFLVRGGSALHEIQGHGASAEDSARDEPSASGKSAQRARGDERASSAASRGSEAPANEKDAAQLKPPTDAEPSAPARVLADAEPSGPAGIRAQREDVARAAEAEVVGPHARASGSAPARDAGGVERADRQGDAASGELPAQGESPTQNEAGVRRGSTGPARGGASAGASAPGGEGASPGEVVPAVRIEPGRSIVSYAREDLRILVARLLRADPGLSEDEVVARATRLLACPADEAELVEVRIRYALHEGD